MQFSPTCGTEKSMAATAASIKVDYWCTGGDRHDSSYLKWKSDVCGVWVVLVSVTDAATLFWHHLCEHKDDISWLKMTSEADVFHCVYKFEFFHHPVHDTSIFVACVCLCAAPPASSLFPSSGSPVGATLRIKWGEIKVYCSVMQSVPPVERWAGCPLRWADTQMI